MAELTGSAAKPVRLSVNLHPDVAEALKHVMAGNGWNATEAVRRLIAVGKFLYDERAAGARLVVQRPGRDDREVVLLP